MLDEVALGADETRARAALAQARSHRSRSSAIRATSRRASASGSRSPPCSSTEPELLVLDEPTRGVDPERKAELAALLRSQAPRRGTLVVTHDLPWAADVADRVVELPLREAVRA